MGVEHVEIDLQSGRVTIAPHRRVELDLSVVPRAVRASGFVPAEMRIRARGTLETRADGMHFRIRSWTRSFPIDDGSRSAGDPNTTVVLDALVHVAAPGVELRLGVIPR